MAQGTIKAVAPYYAIPQVGEIRMFGGSTCPSKWLFCDGSTINRSTYSALFAVIGTTYGGGDGSTTFAIPTFKGRSPLGVGESGATGHTNHTLGSYGGEETHTLTEAQLAQHSHTRSVSASTSGKYKKTCASGTNQNRVDSDGTSSTTGPYSTTVNLTINNAGSNSAHNTMHPYETVNFIIFAGV